MAVRLRSALLLSFTAVFFFNVCVFGLVLSVQLHLHQQEQQSKIKTKKQKEIIELRIERQLVETVNDRFQWKEHNEFRFDGEMYDVEESFTEGNVWVFFVEHDSKEDSIRKQIDAEEEEDEAKKRHAPAKKNVKSSPQFFERTDFVLHIPEPHLQLNEETEAELLVAHNILPDPPPWFGQC